MKISVISFDHWNYDAHIVDMLRELGINAHHIKIGNFRHKNLGARLQNTLSKIFFNKNLKHTKRQEFILEELNKLGKQDQILVINPELIDKEYHLKIKNFTDRYIAYLYDSMARYSISHLLQGIFDDIYSFDKEDIEKYNFKETTNYNYLDNRKLSKKKEIFDVKYLGSYDERILDLLKLSKILDTFNATYQFVISGKKSWKKQVLFKNNKNFAFRTKRIQHQDLSDFYSDTKVILDLLRKNQSGLSFRVFEAMAMEKKLITNNQKIKHYDFYNPNNILVLNEDFSTISKEFFSLPYQKIPTGIYAKYTLETWVKKIFEL